MPVLAGRLVQWDYVRERSERSDAVKKLLACLNLQSQNRAQKLRENRQNDEQKITE